MAKTRKNTWGIVPTVASLGSVVACYGTILFIALLSLMGITIFVHEGAWAATITAFAFVAALGLGVNAKRSRNYGPLIMGLLGLALISWAMFGTFDRIVEIIGFIALLGAVFWDWRIRRTHQHFES